MSTQIICKTFDFHIYVTGYFNAGKTTLIHSCDPDAISIEKSISDATKQRLKIETNSEKTETTTGFDRGCLCWARPNLSSSTNGVLLSLKELEKELDCYQNWIFKFVELRGVPGQLQFKSVRQILSNKMDGTVFLVDGCDLNNIGNAIAILEETRIYMDQKKPIVIVANKCDRSDFQGAEVISTLMGENVFIASALKRIGLKDAIIKILKEIEIQKTPLIVNPSCITR